MMLSISIMIVALAAFWPLLDAAITIVTGKMNDQPRHAMRLLVWRGIGYMFLSPIAYVVVILFNGFFPNIEITKDYALVAMFAWATCGSVASTIGMIMKSRL